MRLHRLISILLTIENQGKITAKKLAEKFETSPRTIYRDIDTLCEAGIPIRAESGPHGGLSLMDGYQTGVKALQKEELLVLLLNGMGVKPEGGSDTALKLNTSLYKLQKLLPRQDDRDINTLVTRFYVDDTPWWGKRSPLKFIDTWMKAIWESRQLSIQYQKMDRQVTSRILHPYGIVVKDTIWYLIGYCESSQDIRTFRCERIVECELLPESFTLPADFSLEEYFQTSLRQFQTDRHAVEQYPVTLRLAKEASGILNDWDDFTARDCGDEVEVSINMYTLENALSDFWNLLIRAVVVAPPELRERVQKRLESLLAEYRT